MTVKKTEINKDKKKEEIIKEAADILLEKVIETTTEPSTVDSTTEPSTVDSTTEPSTVEDDDSDMPTQESKTYRTFLIVKPLFKELLGEMPYTTSFGYRGYPGIKTYSLQDVQNIINSAERLDINTMNVIIAIISSGPYAVVNKFMSYIVDGEKQKELWMVVQDV